MVALRALKNGSSSCARKTYATCYHFLKETLLILITDDKSVDIFTSVNENQGVPIAHFSGALDPLNNKGLRLLCYPVENQILVEFVTAGLTQVCLLLLFPV